jgi:hypothetical protein
MMHCYLHVYFHGFILCVVMLVCIFMGISCICCMYMFTVIFMYLQMYLYVYVLYIMLPQDFCVCMF